MLFEGDVFFPIQLFIIQSRLCFCAFDGEHFLHLVNLYVFADDKNKNTTQEDGRHPACHFHKCLCSPFHWLADTKVLA